MKKEFKAIALTLRSTLSPIWNVLFTSVSDEPRIWQERDPVRISFAARFGNVWWYLLQECLFFVYPSLYEKQAN